MEVQHTVRQKYLAKVTEELKTCLASFDVHPGSRLFMRSIHEKVPSICSEVNPETEGRDDRVEQEGEGQAPNLPH